MAATDTTRLLVLGATRIFEPANGYQLRRELLSWQVENWANVNPGSIYSMLSTLSKQGMLDRTDVVATSGANPVAMYRTTPAGKKELLGLIRGGIVTVRQFEPSQFYAAASLMASTLDRAEIGRLLRARIKNLEVAIEALEKRAERTRADQGSPPHVHRLVGYEVELNRAEIAWLDEFAADVEQGRMTFTGESEMENWTPQENDPAWRMAAERDLYLRKLDRTDE